VCITPPRRRVFSEKNTLCRVPHAGVKHFNFSLCHEELDECESVDIFNYWRKNSDKKSRVTDSLIHIYYGLLGISLNKYIMIVGIRLQKYVLIERLKKNVTFLGRIK
jgi:hypothetical protein